MSKLNSIMAHHAGARLYRQVQGRYPSPGELAKFVQGEGMAREELAAYAARGDADIAAQVLRDLERTAPSLGEVYQRLRGLDEKKGLGQVFTPAAAVEAALDLAGDLLPEKIIDPACGAGDFLLAAARRWPGAQVTGMDIDPLALAVAGTNMTLATGKAQLILANALKSGADGERDLVMGNPPWGCKLSREDVPGYTIAGDKLLNSFVYFLELAARLLRPGGRLIYILPEAFVKVWTYQSARRWLLENFALTGLHYIPYLFRDFYAPAMILAAVRLPAPTPKTIPVWYQRRIQDEKKRYNSIPPGVLTAERFNINWNREMEELWRHCRWGAQYLEEASLGDSVPPDTAAVDFSLGIVTGDNRRHVLRRRRCPEEMPILSARDVQAFAIQRPSRWLRYDADALQQAAPLEKYTVPRKIVYKFIAREIIAAVDDSGSLTLNNLNIIVPLALPFALEYLTALLNSKLLNTLYMYRFFTGKVLTRHIKQLPLKMGKEGEQKQIAALARSLAAGRGDREELEKAVFDLYDLDSPQRELVENQYRRLRDIFFV